MPHVIYILFTSFTTPVLLPKIPTKKLEVNLEAVLWQDVQIAAFRQAGLQTECSKLKFKRDMEIYLLSLPWF